MNFYDQGMQQALFDLGLEKNATFLNTATRVPRWSQQIFGPINERFVQPLLKPVMEHLEKREMRQGLEQLRKALPSAVPGPTAGSVNLTVPGGRGLIFKRPDRTMTVSGDAIEEALGVHPIAARRAATPTAAPTLRSVPAAAAPMGEVV